MVATRKCGRGTFYRKSYTRKGRRISGRCIRKQTRAVKTSSEYGRNVRRTMGLRMRGFRKSARSIQSCPPGSVLRAPHVRYTKRGKHVRMSAACIPDVGAPGKGLKGRPGIGILKEGELTKYGYSKIASLSIEARHSALKKAVNAYGSLTVWRKLNALSVYTRRTSPKTSRIAKEDMDWIRKTWGLKAF